MIRSDANRIALRATRAILDAAHDFSFEIAGKTIAVACTRQAAPAWPPTVPGLDEAQDGPWPTPLTLEARWDGGSSRLTLACEAWSPSPAVGNLVSLAASISTTRRRVLWITLATPLREAADGTVVPILGSATPGRRVEDEGAGEYGRHTASLRAALSGAALPFRSAGNAQLGGVEVPGGAVAPSPSVAFERCVILTIAKHAWFERRTRAGFEGAPFVDVLALAGATAAPVAAEGVATEKRAGIWPLPGGVRAYATTLEALLRDVEARGRLAVEELDALLEERYDATGKTAVKGYHFILRATGYCTETDAEFTLTDAGQAWLADPDPLALFEVLHATFVGMLEPLVLAELAPTLPRTRVHEVLREVLGTEWKTGNQVDFRRNWLLSLGLTDRTGAGDVLTPAGARVLAAHPDEAEEARVAIRDSLTEGAEPATDPPLDDDAIELPEAPAPSGAAAATGAPGWLSAHLDLSAATITAHLGRLQLDERVVHQLAAAVSSGKHVLFVGPPGTGKTELAVALTRAAAAEGYCTGLYTATASADWTTFDTIGGYAMQKDNTLAFRPGAFLRAIQDQKWLLVDELNRADVDRAFGELMTVLAGQGTDTHYELDGGRRVSIGPEETRTFRVPRSFRVLATMNVWDKTSLFRLSYAVQRRFAMITVGLPPDEAYASLLQNAATDGALLPPLAPAHLPTLTRLFSTGGLLSVREIGPAVALDVVRYLRRRGDSADGLAEALELFVLPQLQGVNERQAKDARAHCEEAVGVGASAVARAALRARFRELFPALGGGDD